MFGVPFLKAGSVGPLNCGVCSLCLGLDQWLVKVSWLGERVSVFWWMEMDRISLESNAMSSSEFGGVYGFDMVLCNLFFNVQG